MNSKVDLKFTDGFGEEFSAESLSWLKNFFKEEYSYWTSTNIKTIQSSPRHRYLEGGDKLINIIDEIKELNEDLVSEQLQRKLRNILGAATSNWLWSNHPFTDRFIDCHKKFGIHGAEKFINFMRNTQQTDEFCAEIFAYEFRFQDSDLTKRRKTEKSALSRMVTNLQQTTADIFSEAETAKSEYIEWHNREVQEKWEHWFKLSSEKYDKFIENCQNEKAELEKVYEEHLRLKKPAKYWETSATKFLCQGLLCLTVLFSFVGGGVWFSYLMYDSWADIAKEQLVNLKTFHGVIIFATMVTFFGFGIRVLSKLAFSTFHLMRDAQERGTLAMLYLSLSREKVIDEKSRDIVLQALFSRAEIGLIGSSSSPTLPSASDLLVNKD
jgi:predicted HicB family RNase H-like nuclease